jgi:hypothetical protein
MDITFERSAMSQRTAPLVLAPRVACGPTA